MSYQGAVYFSADDGTNDVQLWKTDGTNAGTVLLKQVNTTFAALPPSDFVEVNGLLYFLAGGGSSRTLWRTDGTEVGTIQLKSGIRTLVEFDGALHAFSSNRIYRSDGTPAGTLPVVQFDAPDGVFPPQPVAVGDLLYFIADHPQHGDEVWKTDGTQAGTSLLKVTSSSNAGFFALAAAGDRLIFQSLSNVGTDLWSSDGTEVDTIPLVGPTPGTILSDPSAFTAFGGLTYFIAASEDVPNGVWVVAAKTYPLSTVRKRTS